MYVKKLSREDFALRSKLWPNNFGKHRPIFAGNSRSTGIYQLRAGNEANIYGLILFQMASQI